MGDNIYLGDRDGVRTPMQWTGDRNGGFSRADFAQLYLPPLMDPVYGYQAVNVEAQLRTPTSLLRWLHRFIALRKEHPVFGARHATRRCAPANHAHLRAHPRATRTTIVLCVHNLARSAQAVELDLSRFEGLRAGGDVRPRRASRAIGELPYLLTLAGRGFFWFQLVRGRRDERRRRSPGLDAASGARRRSSARSAGSASKSREVAGVDDRRRGALRDASAGARRRARRGRASAPGTHDVYQLVARRRPATSAVGDAIAALGRRDGLRGGRRPGIRARARRRCSAAARCSTAGDGTLEFRGDRAATATPPSRRRAPARRRAVEHVGRLRRRADPEGLPPGRGRA